MNRREFSRLTAGALTALSCRPFVGLAKQGALERLTALSIQEASELVKRREVSPVALTEACLARIEKYDRKINAFITVTADLARRQAQAAEAEIIRGHWRGPLHGIPVALKDNIDTAGIKTTAASRVYADRIPTEDAEVVRRLKDAGMVLLGKLNMGEFAMNESVISHWGAVYNPWALDHEAGGSSSGSAAAVSADLCFAALGTDTGGSIRMPASRCSIVGLKPTYGLVSNRGVIPLAESMDHVGPLCKTVGDAALLLQAIAGHDAKWSESAAVTIPNYSAALNAPVSELRVGVVKSKYLDGLEPEVAAAYFQAVNIVRSLTGHVGEVAIPEVDDDAESIFPGSIFPIELCRYHRPLLERSRALYQSSTQRRFAELFNNCAEPMHGSADYSVAVQRLQQRRVAANRLFDNVDLLVLPTMKIAPRTNELMMELEHQVPAAVPDYWSTGIFNLLGLPAISVPCGFTIAGLPVGLQIAGAPFAEVKVLAFAQAYERATRWHLRKPTMAAHAAK